MTGKNIDCKNICKLHFSTYAQVYKDINVTNTLEKITHGAICIGHTGNLQVTYYFFSLRTKKLTQGYFTEVPTPTIAMKQLAKMALAEKQYEGIIFKNRLGIVVYDILIYFYSSKAFRYINGNITEVDLEAGPLDAQLP